MQGEIKISMLEVQRMLGVDHRITDIWVNAYMDEMTIEFDPSRRRDFTPAGRTSSE